MKTIKKTRKKIKIRRSFKESLKILLGKSLLETKPRAAMNLILLKGALSTSLLQ